MKGWQQFKSEEPRRIFREEGTLIAGREIEGREIYKFLSSGEYMLMQIPAIVPVIISSAALLVSALNAIWSARTAWVWKREERESKRPYVIVEKLEWVKGEGIAGELRVTIKNAGTRPARNVAVTVRMIDYRMQHLPAPDFDFYAVNDMPSGMEFTQANAWNAPPSLPVSRVQVRVIADDPLVCHSCPPLMFYYVWGDISDKYDKMPPDHPFRSATRQEHAELNAYLANRVDARQTYGKETILMLPGMPRS